MQPMGRKPSRFPGKTDCHPRKPYVNWWEAEICAGDKRKSARQAARQDITVQLSELGCGDSND